MRILHISHTGLPDPRIEKAANTMKKDGNELIFLGGKVTSETSQSFHEIHYEPIGNNLSVVIDPRFKKRWRKAISDLKPDVVHAHNLIVGRVMLDMDYPVIYDDHEYWSQQSFKYDSKKFVRRMASKPLSRASPKWEKEILEKYPVITVSQNIAKDHRRYSDNVFVVKNYPSLDQVRELKSSEDRAGTVYVGNDFKLSRFLPHRNMEGLQDIIQFDILSGLNHNTLMRKLTEYQVGITPWLAHPFHKYCEPNKHYEYLNAGLQIIITDSLSHPFQNEPYAHSFSMYEDIPTIIENLPDIDSNTIMEHARRNYTWENQEDIIKEVYKHI